MEQNRIFDIIISLLIGIKNHDCLTETTDSGEVLTVTQCKYLLNQTIRQYQIPKDHYFVSEAALELWQKIRRDSIFNYTYRDKVVKTIHEPVWIDKYNGSRKKPYQSLYLNCGESFTYNDVFTDEHIVTVSDIIKELKALPSYDYAEIKKVLDKIYICKVLKEEDHNIKNKHTRPTDYQLVINTDYFDAGIKVLRFNEVTFQQENEQFIYPPKIKENIVRSTFNSNVLSYIHEWCNEKIKSGDISFGHHKSNKKYTRFTTSNLDNIFPYYDNLKSGWGNGHFYAYEIINYNSEFKIVLTFCNINAPKQIKDVFTCAMNWTSKTPGKSDWQWKYIFSTTAFTYNDKTTKEEIYQALDIKFSKIKDEVRKLLEIL